MNPLIEVRDGEVRFGHVTALTGLNLRVAKGDRIAVIGGNGSGKSTLLRLLHGLIAASSGSVVRGSGARDGMLFQRPWLMRTTALNNVALGLWMRGVPWRSAKERARAAISRVGLGAVSMRSARALSGGQQQRLALARVWSLEPDVLFLDEPTSNLDPHGKREVESLMAEFADAGMTLVFASHNLGQVKRLATRVIYLEQGRVLADLPVGAFFDREGLRRTSLEADIFLRGETV